MTRLPEAAVILPVQVLGGAVSVLTGKLRQAPHRPGCGAPLERRHTVRDSTWGALQSALDLSLAHA